MQKRFNMILQSISGNRNKYLLEQEKTEEEIPPETKTEEIPKEKTPTEKGEETEVSPGEEEGGGEEIVGGEPEKEEVKTDDEVGRLYELKKVYSRLVSIDTYLANSADIELGKLRDYVSKVIDLFDTIMSNIDSYRDNIDEIIVQFYSFLEDVYRTLQEYYKKKHDREEKESSQTISSFEPQLDNK